MRRARALVATVARSTLICPADQADGKRAHSLPRAGASARGQSVSAGGCSTCCPPCHGGGRRCVGWLASWLAGIEPSRSASATPSAPAKNAALLLALGELHRPAPRSCHQLGQALSLALALALAISLLREAASPPSPPLWTAGSAAGPLKRATMAAPASRLSTRTVSRSDRRSDHSPAPGPGDDPASTFAAPRKTEDGAADRAGARGTGGAGMRLVRGGTLSASSPTSPASSGMRARACAPAPAPAVPHAERFLARATKGSMSPAKGPPGDEPAPGSAHRGQAAPVASGHSRRTAADAPATPGLALAGAGNHSDRQPEDARASARAGSAGGGTQAGALAPGGKEPWQCGHSAKPPTPLPPTTKPQRHPRQSPGHTGPPTWGGERPVSHGGLQLAAPLPPRSDTRETGLPATSVGLHHQAPFPLPVPEPLAEGIDHEREATALRHPSDRQAGRAQAPGEVQGMPTTLAAPPRGGAQSVGKRTAGEPSCSTSLAPPGTLPRWSVTPAASSGRSATLDARRSVPAPPEAMSRPGVAIRIPQALEAGADMRSVASGTHRPGHTRFGSAQGPGGNGQSSSATDASGHALSPPARACLPTPALRDGARHQAAFTASDERVPSASILSRPCPESGSVLDLDSAGPFRCGWSASANLANPGSLETPFGQAACELAARDADVGDQAPHKGKPQFPPLGPGSEGKFCGFVARTFAELEQHRLEAHGFPGASGPTCPVCLRRTGSASQLLRHARACHMLQRRWACSECGRAFATASNRNAHVRTVHKRARPFSCPVCNKALSRRTHLRVHCKKLHMLDIDDAGSMRPILARARRAETSGSSPWLGDDVESGWPPEHTHQDASPRRRDGAPNAKAGAQGPASGPGMLQALSEATARHLLPSVVQAAPRGAARLDPSHATGQAHPATRTAAPVDSSSAEGWMAAEAQSSWPASGGAMSAPAGRPLEARAAAGSATSMLPEHPSGSTPRAEHGSAGNLASRWPGASASLDLGQPGAAASGLQPDDALHGMPGSAVPTPGVSPVGHSPSPQDSFSGQQQQQQQPDTQRGEAADTRADLSTAAPPNDWARYPRCQQPPQQERPRQELAQDCRSSSESPSAARAAQEAATQAAIRAAQAMRASRGMAEAERAAHVFVRPPHPSPQPALPAWMPPQWATEAPRDVALMLAGQPPVAGTMAPPPGFGRVPLQHAQGHGANLFTTAHGPHRGWPPRPGGSGASVTGTAASAGSSRVDHGAASAGPPRGIGDTASCSSGSAVPSSSAAGWSPSSSAATASQFVSASVAAVSGVSMPSPSPPPPCSGAWSEGEPTPGGSESYASLERACNWQYNAMAAAAAAAAGQRHAASAASSMAMLRLMGCAAAYPGPMPYASKQAGPVGMWDPSYRREPGPWSPQAPAPSLVWPGSAMYVPNNWHWQAARSASQPHGWQQQSQVRLRVAGDSGTFPGPSPCGAHSVRPPSLGGYDAAAPAAASGGQAPVPGESNCEA